MVLSKTSIQNLKPYTNGFHSGDVFSEGAKVIKLDSNEATASPSPRVLVALTEFIQSAGLNWYPDIHSKALIAKLARYTNMPESRIQTFNGSDNALEIICRTFLSPKDEVVLCSPTYDHFRVYAESCDATLVPAVGPSPFVPKVEVLLDKITDQTKIIYIVNPNNPTGMIYNQEEIRTILEKAPQSLLIVDEAYFEFSGITLTNLVPEYKNLIITRSFSKAFGLAGLRCGYVMAQENILDPINKIRIGKNVNMLAQIASSAALDDLDHMNQFVSEVKLSKEWLCSKLREMNLKVVSTPANFVLVKVKHPSQVTRYLEDQNIFIRNRNDVPQLEGFVRVTIGHQFIMERFWQIFKKTPENFLFGNSHNVQKLSS